MRTPLTSLTAIQEMIEDYKFVNEIIILQDPSMSQRLSKHLKKMFVLACASYYESKITSSIGEYAKKHSNKYGQNPNGFDYLGGISFFKLFDFGRNGMKTVNGFLNPIACVGKEFKSCIINEITSDGEKEKSMYAFQEMCSLRNSLSHNDLILADDAIESKTFDDVTDLHESALKFVEYLVTKFTG